MSKELVVADSPLLGAAIRMLGRDLMLRGILEALLGVLLLVRPVQTAVVLTVAIGVFLLIDGATMLLIGLKAPGPGKKWLIINAVLLLLLGVFAVWRPIMVDSLWVVILGIWQLMGGIEALAGGGAKLWNVLLGVLSLALGVVFIVSPFVGLLSIIWLIGVLLVLSGALTILAGVKLRI